MIRVNAIGDNCPIPVVKTLNAIKALQQPDMVETLVDNEIAIQNLARMAAQKGYSISTRQLGDREFAATITVGEVTQDRTSDTAELVCQLPRGKGKNTVVVISSGTMGQASEELGAALLKGFLYALSQQEQLPATILFYNGGASVTCRGSVSVEDLQDMEARGVEILTCGTCLNYYGLTESLAVGSVTNMYTIVKKMTGADLLIKP